MEHLDKLDVLLRTGSGGQQIRLTMRHVRDQIHRECVAGNYNVSGVTRRNMVKSWYASLSYLLNEDCNRLDIKQNRSDWTDQATDLRDHAHKLINGRRMTMKPQTELAGALNDLADLVDCLEKIVQGVAGPWAPLLAAIEARRDALASPVGTPGRQDDYTNVHIVLKAHEVRAILGENPDQALVPPVDRVYTPFRTIGQAFHEFTTGYGLVGPDKKLRAVIYNAPTSQESIKASARAAGCDLYFVEVRVTDQIDTSPPKSRDDVLRETALKSLPPDVAEELLKRAGLPPF